MFFLCFFEGESASFLFIVFLEMIKFRSFIQKMLKEVALWGANVLNIIYVKIWDKNVRKSLHNKGVDLKNCTCRNA